MAAREQFAYLVTPKDGPSVELTRKADGLLGVAAVDAGQPLPPELVRLVDQVEELWRRNNDGDEQEGVRLLEAAGCHVQDITEKARGRMDYPLSDTMPTTTG